MTSVLANASAKDRPDTDFYPTPYAVTQSLLDFLKIDDSNVIWEPACGQGHMIKVLEENGYSTVGTELNCDHPVDFLKTKKLSGSWIITNPPFILSQEFIRHSHSLRPTGFAMLLKSQYWHATKRRSLFYDIRPKYVLPLSWRPDFLFGAKGSAPTMEVLWTVWEKGYTGPTMYEILERPKSGI